MGLDVILFDKANRLISMHEIEEVLHQAIFASDRRWGSYLFLRKLSDYYRTNEEFSEMSLKGLDSDLICYRAHLPVEFLPSYQVLLEAISDPDVKKIGINSD